MDDFWGNKPPFANRFTIESKQMSECGILLFNTLATFVYIYDMRI